MHGEQGARNCFGDANLVTDMPRFCHPSSPSQANDLTPLAASALFGHSAVIRLLIEHGAAVDLQVRVPYDRFM